ncbi:carbohydrate ABC transporter permease [Paenibacillus sp. J5C_2022]|uniref:carbohydrate ABC transporter permease n=1 Tax=Paenibacillus sp. J5C2022 TaxID=2977129 RepID=UPI0021D15362|nr:carbohydrate ABC transporter permease [Paenibacillus sp. J5C2022]MCU6711597.1 carbohydrate ABC transporter permease [Paenibacillus sp. J5C2022]
MNATIRKLRKFLSLKRMLLIALLTAVGLFMFLPIIFLFNHAFKPLNELFLFPPTIFVKEPTLRNFEQLLLHTSSGLVPFSRYLFNSAVISAVATLSVILVSTMAGYVLSKHRFHFKTLIMGAIMISLMFVPETVAIPRYLVVSGLGLKDTYFAHILPFLASPVAVFLMKQFIDQIPDSLIDAAKLDGATDMYIFTRIIIPLTSPAVATVSIITFQAVYMDIEVSTFFMTKETMKTLAYYATAMTVNVPGVAATSLAAAIGLLIFLPNMIMFLIFQRKVIQTMLHSGVK